MYPATNGGLPDSLVVNPTPEYRTRDQGFFFGGGGGGWCCFEICFIKLLQSRVVCAVINFIQVTKIFRV